LFEWALNWCVANHVRQYLTFHAAMLEKGGHAIILPGVPGAGKSTLCAALACRGWRLLTDEITMISTRDNMAVPVPRPVSLKNESIDVIRSFAPDAVIGDRAHNTAKGTVANMKPSLESVKNARQCVRPAWVVFPRYRQGAETQLEPVSKCEAFMRLIEYSFNYHVTGVRGFQAVGKMLDDCETYRFSYSDLEEAIALFDGFHQDKAEALAGGEA
jgi:HprK-related kinase A